MNANQRTKFLMITLAKSEKARRRRSLRPVDLLFPAMIAQVLVFAYASCLPPKRALIHASIGNFIIISGLAMLPSLWARPVKAHWVR